MVSYLFAAAAIIRAVVPSRARMPASFPIRTLATLVNPPAAAIMSAVSPALFCLPAHSSVKSSTAAS